MHAHVLNLTRGMQSALCGSIGGGISAALTTPLDVIKTRMMLGADFGGVHYRGIGDTVCYIGHNMGRCRVGYVGPVYGLGFRYIGRVRDVHGTM